MTRIYEALEQAGKERGEAQPVSFTLPPSAPSKALEEKLLALYRRIETALAAERRGKIVEFAGCQFGDDSSRILVAFARLIVTRLGKKALLLSPGPLRWPGAPPAVQGWEAVISGDRSIDEAIVPLGDGRLVASQIASSEASLAALIDVREFQGLLNVLRDRFDIILIDAPPIPASHTAELLAGVADGVVLIVEAGRTRWQVVKHAMDEIAAQKGTVLGVVLNKVRYYIPDFIYRKLP
jgi:Mrp family chromosome partitioning ATPase